MLTEANYFSPEMNFKYMSTSQWKSFNSCESMALAELRGEYLREKTECMLLGSYLDAYYSKTLDLFKTQEPEIFTKKGELRSNFYYVECIIERLERDPLFTKYMSGEPQVIKTGEIEGIPFKVKIDSYHPKKAIVDLKLVKDFKKQWKDGLKISFVEWWEYDIGASIYCAVEGNNLPFFIAGATKEKPEPDLAIISIPQERLDYCLDIVKQNVKRYADIKLGLIEPSHCGICDYCKSKKVLTKIIDYLEV